MRCVSVTGFAYLHIQEHEGHNNQYKQWSIPKQEEN